MAQQNGAKLIVTPSELSGMIIEKVAEICGCQGTFAQHAGPITRAEHAQLTITLNALLMRCAPDGQS